jgi:hypothetical protein
MISYEVKVKMNTKGLENAIDIGMTHLCEQIVDDAKLALEENDNVFTGQLRDSITWEKVDENTWIVKADAHYAAAIEFGTEPHFVKFYEDGNLTSLGNWAIQKLGFTPAGDNSHLIAQAYGPGKENRFGGLWVNDAHPYMYWALEKNAPYMAEQFIKQSIEER